MKKLFSNPLFAVLIAAALIVASSLLSVKLKIRGLAPEEVRVLAEHFPGFWLIP